MLIIHWWRTGIYQNWFQSIKKCLLNVVVVDIKRQDTKSGIFITGPPLNEALHLHLLVASAVSVKS